MNTMKRSTAVLAVAVLSGLGVVSLTVSGHGIDRAAYAAHSVLAADSGDGGGSGASPNNEDWG